MHNEHEMRIRNHFRNGVVQTFLSARAGKNACPTPIWKWLVTEASTEPISVRLAWLGRSLRPVVLSGVGYPCAWDSLADGSCE
jgi:hypothetical protein